LIDVKHVRMQIEADLAHVETAIRNRLGADGIGRLWAFSAWRLGPPGEVLPASAGAPLSAAGDAFEIADSALPRVAAGVVTLAENHLPHVPVFGASGTTD